MTTKYPLTRKYNDNAKTLYELDPYFEASFVLENKLFSNDTKDMY